MYLHLFNILLCASNEMQLLTRRRRKVLPRWHPSGWTRQTGQRWLRGHNLKKFKCLLAMHRQPNNGHRLPVAGALEAVESQHPFRQIVPMNINSESVGLTKLTN